MHYKKILKKQETKIEHNLIKVEHDGFTFSA
jgi:hypothetical protein